MNQEKHVKKAFFWNMVGSTCYSGSSFLFLMVVTRLCGVEIAGFYSLSYATAQLLLQVGRYGMRTYQATDLQDSYSFREYQVSRLFTCGVMMLGGLIYSAVSFSGEQIVASLFIILMKMVDAVEDVYHGNFQRIYHVESMGKLLALRNIFTALVFSAVLWKTRDLTVTSIISAVLSLIFCIGANESVTRRYLSRSRYGSVALSRVRRLLVHCTPLFAGTFLSLFLYNIPKYAMSGVLSDSFQTYYSILFMPSFVITLMCEFLFKPTITTIADLWWKQERKRFLRYVLTILGLIALADLGILVAGDLLGRRLLEIFYGVSLSAYRKHFLVLLLGGGFSSMVYMMYNVLIAIRKEQFVLPVYLIVTVLTLLPARLMVKSLGMMGAALNYVLSCLLLAVFFGSILFRETKERS